MSTFKCAICEQDVDMFDHGRLECGTAMRRERDSAMARLKVAEDALDVLYAEASMLHKKNFDFSLPRVRKALRKSHEALTAIRADAGPAKAETTCPMHGKTDCCCG